MHYALKSLSGETKIILKKNRPTTPNSFRLNKTVQPDPSIKTSFHTRRYLSWPVIEAHRRRLFIFFCMQPSNQQQLYKSKTRNFIKSFDPIYIGLQPSLAATIAS